MTLGINVDHSECFYGDAFPGPTTTLYALGLFNDHLGPGEWKLQATIPELAQADPGRMVWECHRYYSVPEHLVPAFENFEHRPDGLPEVVTKITYGVDPSTGQWLHTLTGNWPLTVSKVEPQTAWERLQNDP